MLAALAGDEGTGQVPLAVVVRLAVMAADCVDTILGVVVMVDRLVVVWLVKATVVVVGEVVAVVVEAVEM